MKKALVGYTGFVGSNICGNERFDGLYNSQNIEEAYGTKPDLLVYAGLRAEKYLANHEPERDLELIHQAENNIMQIAPKKLVLISTVDVLKDPAGADENTLIDTEGLNAYGANRYVLEQFVRKEYPEALIIRLPGLFGKNIKKNFIYDYMNRIPFMLTEAKMQELCEKDPELKIYYQMQDNGFFKVAELSAENRSLLRKKFDLLGFSALNFTDSRNVYQFYPLERLWSDIVTALKNDIRLLHPATEPVAAGELYGYLTGEAFVNELAGKPVSYDFRTIYDKVYNGEKGYICSKQQVMEAIRKFVMEYRK